MLVSDLITQWHNAVFTVSICTFLVYSLVYAIMGGHDSEYGPDIEHDMDIDHDIDHAIEHDMEHDHDAGCSGSTIAHALSFLGVGRCPISIVMIVLGISWGFFGLISNIFFHKIGIIPHQIYFWFSFGIATFLGVFVTRYCSLNVAKLLPRTGTSAVGPTALVGKYGETSTTVDANRGNAKVYDQYGTLHNISCVTEEDPIGVNTQVFVLQYKEKKKLYTVIRKPELLKKGERDS